MRQHRGQSDNSTAKLVGNLLMGAGVMTPVVGVIFTKFVTIDFDTYPRVLQAVFSTGLLFSVSGILVKNYWTKGKAATKRGIVSNATKGIMPILICGSRIEVEHDLRSATTKRLMWGLVLACLANPGVWLVVKFTQSLAAM